MAQRMHMTHVETQRVDKLRVAGKSPLEALALLPNRIPDAREGAGPVARMRPFML